MRPPAAPGSSSIQRYCRAHSEGVTHKDWRHKDQWASHTRWWWHRGCWAAWDTETSAHQHEESNSEHRRGSMSQAGKPGSDHSYCKVQKQQQKSRKRQRWNPNFPSITQRHREVPSCPKPQAPGSSKGTSNEPHRCENSTSLSLQNTSLAAKYCTLLRTESSALWRIKAQMSKMLSRVHLCPPQVTPRAFPFLTQPGVSEEPFSGEGSQSL